MMINHSVKIIVLACLFLVGCAGNPEIDKPVELTPVPKLLEQGKNKLQLSQYVAAIFIFEQALEQEPNNTLALLGLADANMAIDKLSDASKLYEKVLTDDPGNLHASEGKGLIYFKRYDYERAKKQLTEVLNKDNRRWNSWNALGIIADLEGAHETAQQHFKMALNDDKTNAKVINNLGYSLMMSRQYTAAEKVFRGGLNYEPDFFRIRNNLAIALAWQSRFDEAINLLVKVVKYEIAYNNIGYIAMLNKQYSVAKSFFKKALFISPSYYVRAARNLEKVNHLMQLESSPDGLETPKH